MFRDCAQVLKMHRPLLRALSRIHMALLRILKHHNLEIRLSKEPYIFSKEPFKKAHLF